jgi:hypothetical protein
LPPQFWRRTLCRSLDNAARKKRTLVQHAKRRRERNVPVATNVRFGSKADMCGATSDVRFGPIADIEKQKRPQQRANSGGISLPVLALSRQKTSPQHVSAKQN